VSLSRWLEGEVGSGLSFLANLDLTPYLGGVYAMGRPQLNEFTVTIHTNEDRVPDGLQYYDQEGCGHESIVFPLEVTLEALIKYHDNHRIQSHSLEPRAPRCTFHAVDSVPETRCELDEHDPSMKHEVRLTW
jgi:hypothetical protein